MLRKYKKLPKGVKLFIVFLAENKNERDQYEYHYKGRKIVVEKSGKRWACYKGFPPAYSFTQEDIKDRTLDGTILPSLVAVQHPSAWMDKNHNKVVHRVVESIDKDIEEFESSERGKKILEKEQSSADVLPEYAKTNVKGRVIKGDTI